MCLRMTVFRFTFNVMVLAEQQIVTPPLRVLRRPTSIVVPGQWKQKERLFNDFRPDQITTPIVEWIAARLSMQHENKNIVFMAVRLYDEIFELLAEHERSAVDFDLAALEKEALDILFFVISLCSNLPGNYIEELDLVSISHSMNGEGGRSDIYEKMAEIAGNLPYSLNLKRDLKVFLGYWFSYIRHSPVRRSPDVILKQVLHKNGTKFEGNYPQLYFSGRDPKTGEVLNEDELHLQQQHARFALRMIREACGYPPEGLRVKDHWPYRHLISDFRNSREGLQYLSAALKLDAQSKAEVDAYRQLVEQDNNQSFESSKRRRQAN